MRHLMTGIVVILTILYPLIIWFGQGHVEPRWLACLLLLAAATRLATFKISPVARWWMLGALLLAAIAIWANALLPLKLYPVLVNVMLLAAFSYSLFVPPSMVERFARLREPNLPEAAIIYTRRVTQVWCVFFIINGMLALATALWASQAIWSLYTGVISYLLMGTLFGIEYLVRLRFKRLHPH
jgi:uncharacterized membrane protein